MRRATVQYTRSSDRVSIAFIAEGIGRGLPVVACLPFHISHVEYAPRLPDRLLRNRRVVTFDGRSTGLAERGIRSLTPAARGLDWEAVIESCGFLQVALWAMRGSSLGAISYAVRYPDRVAALVLVEPFLHGAEHWRSRRALALTELARRDWTAYTESVAFLALQDRDYTTADIRRHALRYRRACTQEDFLAYVEAECESDVRALAHEVTAPVLIVKATHDTVLNVIESVEQITRFFPAARLVAGGSLDTPLIVDDFLTEMFPNALTTDVRLGRQISPLTARECEVLALIATGQSNAAIGAELHLSIRTVERHTQNIYNKLGAHNRIEAANIAREHGLP